MSTDGLFMSLPFEVFDCDACGKLCRERDIVFLEAIGEFFLGWEIPLGCTILAEDCGRGTAPVEEDGRDMVPLG